VTERRSLLRSTRVTIEIQSVLFHEPGQPEERRSIGREATNTRDQYSIVPACQRLGVGIIPKGFGSRNVWSKKAIHEEAPAPDPSAAAMPSIQASAGSNTSNVDEVPANRQRMQSHVLAFEPFATAAVGLDDVSGIEMGAVMSALEQIGNGLASLAYAGNSKLVKSR